jgi:hypothetical protein
MMEPLVSEGPLCKQHASLLSFLRLTRACKDVSGEQIKRNLTENETGIPMTMDIQVVDVKTCKPLQDVAVDVWGCNTTVSFRADSPGETHAELTTATGHIQRRLELLQEGGR